MTRQLVIRLRAAWLCMTGGSVIINSVINGDGISGKSDRMLVANNEFAPASVEIESYSEVPTQWLERPGWYCFTSDDLISDRCIEHNESGLGWVGEPNL